MAEGHEDSFQKLNIALKQYKSGVSSMWNYTEEDINNLMAVAFDYIRLNLPQNDIRDIFRKPSQTNGSIFSSKDRWNRFFVKHNDIVNGFEEKPIEDYVKDATGADITPCLQARDAAWRKAMESQLTETFKSAQDEIDSQLRSSTPLLLITKAQGALNSIDTNSQGFKSNAQSILEGLAELIKTAESIKSRIDE